MEGFACGSSNKNEFGMRFVGLLESGHGRAAGRSIDSRVILDVQP